MKIAIRSERINKWFRGGESIKYEKYNPTKRNLKLDTTKTYYTLSFTYTFQYDNDTVSFAFSEPYTYTQLQRFLTSIKHNCEHKVLCNTISGLKCDLLTITNDEKDDNKRSIVLTARVHPGETVSSWMMEGLIEYLISERGEYIREECIVNVVPMINPDGVMQGNYRCSLSGCDLNRKYITPSKLFHPEIFHLKAMVQKLNKEAPLLFYCDLHGHSKK